MRIMVRADNPGGRGRAATVLRNQGLLVDGTDPIFGAFTNRPVTGLRIDDIGPITITQEVNSGPPDFTVITPAVIDPAYHANLWIVEPLRTQLKNAFTGTPGGTTDEQGVFHPDEDENNDLFAKLRAAGTHSAKTVINGIKRQEGYTTATNVTFYLPRWVATPRRVWC